MPGPLDPTVDLTGRVRRRPGDVAPIDLTPTDKPPTDVPPIDVRPIDVRPVDVTPIDLQPIDIVPDILRDDIGRVLRDRLRPPIVDVVPGKVADPVEADGDSLTKLARKLLTADGKRVVWSKRGAEVLVQLDTIRIGVTDGTIVVAITLQSDQTGPQEINVPFAVGDATLEAGLVATAPSRANGDPVLVQAWGDNVIAFAWQLVTQLATAIAGEVGTDTKGRPLKPASLRATKNGLNVVAQATQVPRVVLKLNPFEPVLPGSSGLPGGTLLSNGALRTGGLRRRRP